MQDEQQTVKQKQPLASRLYMNAISYRTALICFQLAMPVKTPF